MKGSAVPELVDKFAGAVGEFSSASKGAYAGEPTALPDLRTAIGTLDGLDTTAIRQAVTTGRGQKRGSFGGVGLLLDLALGIGGGIISERLGNDNDNHDRQLDDACGLEEDADRCCEAIDRIEGDSDIGLRELFLAATPIIEVLTMLLRFTPKGAIASTIINAGISIIENTISTGMDTCQDRDEQVDKCLDTWITRCEEHCDGEESRPPKEAPKCEEDQAQPTPAPEPQPQDCGPQGAAPKDPNGGATEQPAPEPQPQDCEPTPEPAPQSEPVERECVEKRAPVKESAPLLSACGVSTVASQAFADVPQEFSSVLEGSISEPVTAEVVEEANAQVDECYQKAVSEVGCEPCVGTSGAVGVALLAIGIAALVEAFDACSEPVPEPEAPPAPEPAPEPPVNLEDVPEPPPPPKQNLEDVPEPPPPPKQNLEDVPEPPPPPKQNLAVPPEPSTQAQSAPSSEPALSDDSRTRKAGTW